jgi:hypothetical protein
MNKHTTGIITLPEALKLRHFKDALKAFGEDVPIDAMKFINDSIELDDWDGIELTLITLIEKEYTFRLDYLIAAIPRNVKTIHSIHGLKPE